MICITIVWQRKNPYILSFKFEYFPIFFIQTSSFKGDQSSLKIAMTIKPSFLPSTYPSLPLLMILTSKQQMPQDGGIGWEARTLAASLWFFPTPKINVNFESNVVLVTIKILQIPEIIVNFVKNTCTHCSTIYAHLEFIILLKYICELCVKQLNKL